VRAFCLPTYDDERAAGVSTRVFVNMGCDDLDSSAEVNHVSICIDAFGSYGSRPACVVSMLPATRGVRCWQPTSVCFGFSTVRGVDAIQDEVYARQVIVAIIVVADLPRNAVREGVLLRIELRPSSRD
jgi:hypothetical protein